MAEYDLVCDACHEPLSPDEAILSWTTEGPVERAHALTHAAHVQAAATDRVDVRRAISPTGYLRFVGERLDHRIDGPEPLRAILWALAPFVMRPDSAVEMDSMRAASFGARLGVKPGTEPIGPASQQQHDAGK